MNQEQFVYWLNGFVELTGGAQPTGTQWKSIVEHLNLVFKKVTPPVDNSTKVATTGFVAQEIAKVVPDAVKEVKATPYEPRQPNSDDWWKEWIEKTQKPGINPPPSPWPQVYPNQPWVSPHQPWLPDQTLIC